MATQAPTIPVIQSTKTYGVFRLMGGNRVIDHNHVNQLKKSMKQNPHMFPSNPIEVNEDMYIIDGQHRCMAAQELGMPVYYVVSEGATLEETRVLNATQRRWRLLDFANSYAATGNKEYEIFVKFVKEYPRIAPGILRAYLSDGQRNNAEADFRSGYFTIPDVIGARVYIEALNHVIRKISFPMNMPLAIALLHLLQGKAGTGADEFDLDVFLHKLDRESARELLHPASTVNGCLRSIENVYNFQSKIPKRLY